MEEIREKRFNKLLVASVTCLVTLGIAFPEPSNGCAEGMYRAPSGICCKLCPPGEFHIRACVASGDFPFCSECEHGFYMDKPNMERQCNKCSSCSADEQIFSTCNSTHDTVCQCKEGYDRDGSSLLCQLQGLSAGQTAAICVVVVVVTGVCIGVFIWRRCRVRVGKQHVETDGLMGDRDEMLQNYYEYLKRKTSYMIDYNSKPGESVLMESRFVQPLLLDYHDQDGAKDHAVITAVTNQKRILEDLRTTGFYCHQLFDPLGGSSERPNLIVLVGVPGIGKTTLTKMMVNKLLSGEKYFHFNFRIVVYVQLRELNSYPSVISLRDILRRQHSELGKLVDDMGYNPRDVLLILDGLDELKKPLDIENACSSLDHEDSKEAIIAGLVTAKLLPEASVLLTTRPVAIDQLHGVKVDRFVEISGFKRPEIKEYLCKLYPDEDLGSNIVLALEKCEHVFNLCYIPAFCYIAGRALKPFVKQDKQFDSESVILTMTDLFSKFLFVLINHHRGKTNARNTVSLLANLALWGIEKHIQLFSDEDLRKVKINPRHLESTFIREMFKSEELNSVKMYSFSHLTIQEYFASLAVYLPGRHPSVKFVKSRSALQTQHTPSEVIGRIMNCNDGRYEMVKRFVWGLASQTPWEILQDCIGPPNKDSQKHIMIWIADSVKVFQKEQHREMINLLHCLFELQDPQTAQNLAKEAAKINFTNTRLSPLDCATLSYVLKCRGNPLDALVLNNCGCQQTEVKELVPAIQMCTELSLERNELADTGMRLLADGLAKAGQHLEALSLYRCSLTEDSGVALRDIINACSSLRNLKLCHNPIKDAGLILLAEATSTGGVQLEELDLWDCSLTENSASALHDIAINCHHLRKLTLSDNKLTDVGVRLLADAVSQGQGCLEELDIWSNCLTEESGSALRDIITASKSLKELGLSHNSLKDPGMMFLAEGMVQGGKHLETLHLWNCSLTEKSGPYLQDIIKSCPNLKKLVLGENMIMDDGVRQLARALLHEREVLLEKLHLQACGMTEKSASALHDIIIACSRLKELRLNENQITDTSVDMMAKAVHHGNEHLEELAIRNCSLTDEVVPALRTIVKGSPRLKLLGAGINSFTDAAISEVDSFTEMNPELQVTV